MKLPVKINTVVERDFNNWINGVLVTSVFFFLSNRSFNQHKAQPDIKFKKM